eukprot:Blabericola_migrator_1__13395@NODE_955_length_5901_cov_91_229345_g663_i0_p4_GENE_NODE_955_length_5901_cov_91_229345_g663_i0NODE_955_length_5901_cov_91_229345_g663_i0_p4_ORF_typecomplete_len291_score46_34Exonuc_V_gamma/PF04257_14/0_0004MAP65_ASE1/PF03999_12/0_0029Phage_tail_APC/PF16778_5/0_014MAD/PF05557_13/0_0089Cluap1/PF10234_9/0_027CENPQ/PF13094_6/0_038BRE1/PF08647_11/0_059DUF4407/PF14362_6/0_051HOOK/PF05622_12/0_054Myosin_tail_1/PF01576_19/0_065FAM184/PF15665_5/0_089PilJ/PF13675_6/0_15T3SSipB
MPSVDVPNSRKHLLKTACLQQPDADDALYRVRRVAFVPGRQDQSARYRGDDHCDGGDTPQSSSRCKENDYHRRRWSPFKHPLILALLMCGVLACVYVKLPPGLLQRRLTEEVVPTQFESSAISADMERQLASFRQSLADWRQAAAQPAAGAEHLAKLQREYEAMRDQHERAMKQLRTLQDKLVRMETEKQLQADIMSRHEQDELSVLKKDIVFDWRVDKSEEGVYSAVHEHAERLKDRTRTGFQDGQTRIQIGVSGFCAFSVSTIIGACKLGNVSERRTDCQTIHDTWPR